MLSELRIRNFALIDRLQVGLGPGLNVLTGETGAGKSIVVGALGLLLGARASAEVVRAGSDRATIEGVFEAGGSGGLAAWLGERGFDAEDGLVILKREVAAEGRSRAWINGSPATVSLLGEVGTFLVSLHGQHEHQTLLKGDEQRTILDAFGGHAREVDAVRSAHAELQRIAVELGTLEQRRREAMQRADLLRFQVSEIGDAAVEAGEEERLEVEVRRLSHAEELIGLAGGALEGVSGERGSAIDRLGEVRRPLDQLVRIDPSQAELSDLFDTAYYAIEELGTRLEAYLAAVEHDPARLEEIRRRQDLLYRLRSKYGPTLEEVAGTLARAREELSLIDGAEWEMAQLVRRREESAAALAAAAAALTEARRSAADILSREVDTVLPELGMEGGRFEIAFRTLDPPGAEGAEQIEFRVSLNRGFEPKSLANVASGGELSRVMLALKTILARLDAVPTLIFDEVDAGIGGRVALQVGEKMRQVAGSHQVLAITHLPQIASLAHLHLRVRKEEGAERTATSVISLSDAEREREIARMLGGDADSEVSVRHARELLERGRGTGGGESGPGEPRSRDYRPAPKTLGR